MGMAVAGLIIGFALVAPSHAEEAKDGQVGVRFDAVPEGVVVRSIRPGMGAEQAGLRVGDLVVAVDGDPVDEDIKAAGRQFRGPIGSTVRFKLRSALATDEREVEVTRNKRVSIHRSDRMDPILARFAAAVRTEKKPSKAREATAALIAHGFGGKRAGKAVGTALARAAAKQPKVARAAIDLLLDQALDDGELRFRIGEALFILEDFAGAVKAFDQAGALQGADVRGDGFTGHVGSDHRRLELLINSLWDTGEKDRARALAAELSRVRDIPGLWRHLGIDSPSPRAPMMARLPPVAPFKTDLLSGGNWSSAAHGNKVVLLAFWATWCGPCKREMPELAEMWESHHGQPFELVAVSVDEGSSDKVNKTSKKWGMPFPVAHDRALGRQFEVTGLPAIRLLGGDGSLRFSGSGYSPDGVAKISRRVDRLLEDLATGAEGEGQRVGDAWTTGTAVLTGFSVVNGALSIAGGPQKVIVGAKGAAPVVLEVADNTVGQELERDVSTKWRGIAGQVVWLDGAVGSQPGSLWIRAFGADGDARWFHTLPSPLVRMAVSGDRLWVAMEKGLVALDVSGTVVASFDIDGANISGAADGGIWAVDGKTRYRVTVDGIASSDPALDGVVVDGTGTWARGGVVQLIEGRFGPDGSSRKIAVRKDDVVIGLDGTGQPAFAMQLDADPEVAAIDVDGDGRDELLVTIRRHGVATIQLEIP
jgi:thiol-disulfide isomerase/thioredoxin